MRATGLHDVNSVRTRVSKRGSLCRSRRPRSESDRDEPSRTGRTRGVDKCAVRARAGIKDVHARQRGAWRPITDSRIRSMASKRDAIQLDSITFYVAECPIFRRCKSLKPIECPRPGTTTSSLAGRRRNSSAAGSGMKAAPLKRPTTASRPGTNQ